MRELKLLGKRKKKGYKSYRGTVGKIAPNVVGRNFKACDNNKKWVTDITEFKVKGRKLYLSPILDLYSNYIVSYKLSTSPTVKFVSDMLEDAFKNNDIDNNLIIHSDQGFHYQSKVYVSKLKERNIVQSMSRKGNCLDNSVIENFFGILKREMYNGEKFESVENLKLEIDKYIEYYNNERISCKWKGKTPHEVRCLRKFV